MEDEEIVQAKAQEMAEILFERHEPKMRAAMIEHFRGDVEERVRAFYAEAGEWPFFKRDPYGRGLTMGTKQSLDQLPPPDPPPPPPRPVSAEERKLGRENKELRDALCRAFCRRDPALQEMFAKQQGITAEAMTESEIDACVDAGDVRSFELYRAKHGRYSDHTEVYEAARMASEENH